jgi:hypothetical protein
MSSNLVPLTVYKGAGHEHIPFVAGSPHITADFHSIRTKTDAPAYVTSGFYKVEAGPKLSAHYAFEEAKYVLSGQIDVYVSPSVLLLFQTAHVGSSLHRSMVVLALLLT